MHWYSSKNPPIWIHQPDTLAKKPHISSPPLLPPLRLCLIPDSNRQTSKPNQSQLLQPSQDTQSTGKRHRQTADLCTRVDSTLLKQPVNRRMSGHIQLYVDGCRVQNQFLPSRKARELTVDLSLQTPTFFQHSGGRRCGKMKIVSRKVENIRSRYIRDPAGELLQFGAYPLFLNCVICSNSSLRPFVLLGCDNMKVSQPWGRAEQLLNRLTR